MKNNLWFIFLATLILNGSCKNKIEKSKNNMTENPLLSEWKTPFGVPPFDNIQNHHYLPAFQQAIEMHQEEIRNISAQKAPPTFDNTILALEESGENLTKIRSVFFAINAAHTNDSLQDVAEKIAPELAAHKDYIFLNENLFQRIKKVYDEKENLDLNDEQKKLLEETYKNFVRSGAVVQGVQKERLKEINSRLATLAQLFGKNVLQDTNAFELYITDVSDLGNLPEGTKANAKKLAEEKGHENGWSFSAQRTMVNPLLQSSTNKDIRKKIFDGYAHVGDQNNENDNKNIILEMVRLRAERAKLLGFETHADFVLSDAMSEKPAAVFAFLDKLWKPALEMAKNERDTLAAKMKIEGSNEPFEASDWRYFVEKVRKEKYNFDEEETRPYFELQNVVQGVFTLANKLFGLKFIENKELPKWHPSQQVYEVTEADGTHLGILYMDFYARASKKGGAWMNELQEQHYKNGVLISPIITTNFNFTSPTEDMPALLSIGEVETVFHEFGHALHGLLSHVTYASLSGTNVPRDFVEFPSQILENWVTEPEFLNLFAKHYQTGATIPTTLIEKMENAGKFNQGFTTVEYMAAAYLDMYYHTLDQADGLNVNAFEKEKIKNLGLIAEIIPRYRSTYFQHIFSGGYSAGYYSYLWAEVLDADGFAAFKESGDLFNPDLAKKYRTLLSKGGTLDGMELYKEFRGHEPGIEALLKRKGFE